MGTLREQLKYLIESQVGTNPRTRPLLTGREMDEFMGVPPSETTQLDRDALVRDVLSRARG